VPAMAIEALPISEDPPPLSSTANSLAVPRRAVCLPTLYQRIWTRAWDGIKLMYRVARLGLSDFTCNR
jgi:hypothetical protein